MIGIIDYKAGNAPSVLNALEAIGASAFLASSEDDILKSEGIILPGVGSAKATMDSLRELKYVEILKQRILYEKVPFLGICIGLQVLFDYSEEDDCACLGLVNGRVKMFDSSKVRVPQMGWNKVEFLKNSSILDGLSKNEYFYFVNSYFVVPENEDIVLAKTYYGEEFCSMIAKGNIFAAQFHIEKSGVVGLKILKNFAALAGGN